jgi:hypothetical protein
LIDQISDIINRIVGSGIQFKNIKGKILAFLFGAIRIYFFGKNSGTGCFSYATRASEKQGLSEVIVLDGVLQSIGNSLLPNNVLKNDGAVFAGRYYEVFHGSVGVGFRL